MCESGLRTIRTSRDVVSKTQYLQGSSRIFSLLDLSVLVFCSLIRFLGLNIIVLNLVGVNLTKPTSDISGSITLDAIKATNENI